MSMRSLSTALLGAILSAAPASRADEPSRPQAKAPAPAPSRSAGSNSKADDNPSVPPRPADSDSPLAAGWPGATKPGTIEVKRYPAYRSAVARARDAGMPADNVLFWPLFNHISRKGIEMTTPVVNTYTPAMLEEAKATGDMSMEFVYRTPTTGETGPGVGAVKVEDHPAATFVCLGLQGRMNADRLRDGAARLKTWLDEHKGEWVADGPPRRLGYHGPMTPADQRLWEIQVPVRPAGAGKK